MLCARFPGGWREEIWGLELEVTSASGSPQWFPPLLYRAAAWALPSDSAHTAFPKEPFIMTHDMNRLEPSAVLWFAITVTCNACFPFIHQMKFSSMAPVPSGPLPKGKDLLSAASLLGSDRKLPGSRDSRPHPGAVLESRQWAWGAPLKGHYVLWMMGGALAQSLAMTGEQQTPSNVLQTTDRLR